MKNASAILLTAIFLISSAAFCMADEKKDHICFRVLDSNEDDVVTFEEFRKFYDNDQETFLAADKDRDGHLTHDEYHDILGHGSE